MEGEWLASKQVGDIDLAQTTSPLTLPPINSVDPGHGSAMNPLRRQASLTRRTTRPGAEGIAKDDFVDVLAIQHIRNIVHEFRSRTPVNFLTLFDTSSSRKPTGVKLVARLLKLTHHQPPASPAPMINARRIVSVRRRSGCSAQEIRRRKTRNHRSRPATITNQCREQNAASWINSALFESNSTSHPQYRCSCHCGSDEPQFIGTWHRPKCGDTNRKRNKSEF